MSVSFSTRCSAGEVSRLPETIACATSDLCLGTGPALDGVTFIDFGFRSAGWRSYDVGGIEIGTWAVSGGHRLWMGRAGGSVVDNGRGVCLRPPGSQGRSSWTGDYVGRTLMVWPQTVERMLERPIGRVTLAKGACAAIRHETINHMLAGLSCALRESPSPDPLLIDGLCLAVLRAALAPPTGDEARCKGRFSDRQAERLRDYVQAHLGTQITVAAQAEPAGLSEGYFIKAFRRTFGLTPHQYVMRERVGRAQELIRTSDLPLPTVAERTGFSSLSNMSRTFGSLTGRTPTGRSSTRPRAG